MIGKLLQPGTQVICRYTWLSIFSWCFFNSSSLSAIYADISDRPLREKPNIVFFLVDDLGWTDVGFVQDHLGEESQYYETPNIDRLAKRSTVFTNAYANAPNCAPSRACLMSGQWTPRHGIYTVGTAKRGKASQRNMFPVENKTELGDRFITLAEALKTAGYKTASMGKWHLGDDPCLQGFEVNIAGNRWGSPRGGGYFSPLDYPNLETNEPDVCLTDKLTDSAIDFISKHQAEPFFLYLTYYAVHTPLQGKPQLIQKYKLKSKTQTHNNPKYASMIETVDDSIGRVLNCLSDKGLDDDTIVVFFSDNGGHGGATDNSPLRGAKGMLYEGGIRVPMSIYWPQQTKQPTVTSVPIQGIDFYPTILSMAEVAAPTGYTLDGIDFSDVIRTQNKLPRTSSNAPSEERDLFWHFPAYLEGKGDPAGGPFRTTPASCIRRGKWKLIRWYETDRKELYNLESDLSEANNLASKFPDQVKTLEQSLDDWIDNVAGFRPTGK